jgi:hypothetical protein
MLRRFISKARRSVGGDKKMAVFATTIGMLLVPLGVLLDVEGYNTVVALWMIIIGIVLLGAGFLFTIKDEITKHKEAKLQEKRRQDEEKRRDRNENRRDRGSYLYLLTQYEILKSLGGSPKIVGIKFRRWLERELLKEEQKASEDDEDDM